LPEMEGLLKFERLTLVVDRFVQLKFVQLGYFFFSIPLDQIFIKTKTISIGLVVCCLLLSHAWKCFSIVLGGHSSIFIRECSLLQYRHGKGG
jgi:hypothetical protein